MCATVLCLVVVFLRISAEALVKPCVECAFPLWCASVFIDGPLAFKLVESFGVLARSSRRLNRQVE